MNIKALNIFGYAAAGALVAVVVGSLALFAHASTGLAVTCSGIASGTDQIAWSATATGGNAPYSFVWSGDSSITNNTSTNVTGTYTADGSYTTMIAVTDASSSVATSSCSQSVTGIVINPATSTLNVVVLVNNAAGGNAAPSSFTASVSGASGTPASFAGSSSGTAVTVLANTVFSVNASSLANYSASESGNCTGSIAAGTSNTCTVTEAYVPPTATSTPPSPRVNPPSLSIGANGSFLARGMTVTSVASGSFQGTVWGITYTVDWAGPSEFYLRYIQGTATSTPGTQLQVGDEVGVAGTISSGSPFVVTANVIRDYSISAPRPVFHIENGGNGRGNEGNGNGNGGPEASVNASASADLGSRLQQLLSQFQSLQNLLKGHGNSH